MKKLSLIIVRGLPGSGKSSFAKLLGRAVCTADDYHTDRNNNYNFSFENIHQAHTWCQRKCRRFMEKEISSIIIANTSTTNKEMKPYYDLAEKHGYEVFSVIVENRHNGRNTHNVPEETLKNMEARFNIKLI